jgi:hypothetical protein
MQNANSGGFLLMPLNFFLSPQSQLRNLKEACPQSQFRNFLKNVAPQLRNRNFFWSPQPESFTFAIFGRFLAWSSLKYIFFYRQVFFLLRGF